MNQNDERFQNIIKIIKKNNVKFLKQYIEVNKIKLNDFNNNEFDILIYAIENESSILMIEFIINCCIKVPLFSALAHNNFKVADLLIKYDADINYSISNQNNCQNLNILHYLNNISFLNEKNLRYILIHDFHIQGVTDDLLYYLIDYDTREPEDILNKYNVYKYYLLENAMVQEEYDIIKKILGNKKITFDFSKLEVIFIKIISINGYDSLKFSLNLLIKNLSLNDKKTVKSLDISILMTFNTSFLSLILNALIQIRHLSLLKFLLENDKLSSYIDINTCDDYNKYPLFVAFYNTFDEENYLKCLEIFKYLLIKGANPKIKRKKGKSLWSSVIENRNYMTIQCLLNNTNIGGISRHNDNNINNLYINHQHHPLKEGKYYSYHNTEEKIEKYYDILKTLNSQHQSTFEIFEWLVEYVDINKKDKYGNNVIFYAIIKNDLQTVKFLINKNIDINFNGNHKRNKEKAINSIESTSFDKFHPNNFLIKPYDTILRGTKRHINTFFEFNLNHNNKYKRKKIDYKDSPLIISININNKEIFLALLEHKDIEYQINEPNQNDETPLIIIIKNQKICIKDKLIMMEQLISKGADVNYINTKDEKSPLIYAIERRIIPMIKLLIKNGANIISDYENCHSNYQKENILIYTIKLGDFELFKYLLDFMIQTTNNEYINNNLISKLINTFDKNKNLEIFEYLIKYKTKINMNELSS
ncbi:ankyrin [Anaeromyces robustus]|uniref:Ankyrin n=1 Tax=Anaeromyces robustus TaxID=1754192 RepID=A0A1Y1X0K6_9FUNG|nr:ankyrin [Anaeromyces robustus]|eukprot:ORX79320.1 ankyrin [Anaeromyces robustus]